jgi:hypothetical protein
MLQLYFRGKFCQLITDCYGFTRKGRETQFWAFVSVCLYSFSDWVEYARKAQSRSEVEKKLGSGKITNEEESDQGDCEYGCGGKSWS